MGLKLAFFTSAPGANELRVTKAVSRLPHYIITNEAIESEHGDSNCLGNKSVTFNTSLIDAANSSSRVRV